MEDENFLIEYKPEHDATTLSQFGTEDLEQSGGGIASVALTPLKNYKSDSHVDNIADEFIVKDSAALSKKPKIFYCPIRDKSLCNKFHHNRHLKIFHRDLCIKCLHCRKVFREQANVSEHESAAPTKMIATKRTTTTTTEALHDDRFSAPKTPRAKDRNSNSPDRSGGVVTTPTTTTAFHDDRLYAPKAPRDPTEPWAKDRQHISPNRFGRDATTTTTATTEKHTCFKCDKYFLTKDLLLQHIKSVHKGSTSPNFTIFTKILEKKDLLDNFLQNQKGLKIINDGTVLRLKVKKSDKPESSLIDKLFPCTKCYRIFPTETDYLRHKKEAHRNFIPMQTENNNIKTLPTYAINTLINSPSRSSNLYPCTKCYRTFPKRINLLEHLEKEHRQSIGYFKCTDCDNCYKDESFLAAHIMEAHGKTINPNIEEKDSEVRLLERPVDGLINTNILDTNGVVKTEDIEISDDSISRDILDANAVVKTEDSNDFINTNILDTKGVVKTEDIEIDVTQFLSTIIKVPSEEDVPADIEHGETVQIDTNMKHLNQPENIFCFACDSMFANKYEWLQHYKHAHGPTVSTDEQSENDDPPNRAQVKSSAERSREFRARRKLLGGPLFVRSTKLAKLTTQRQRRARQKRLAVEFDNQQSVKNNDEEPSPEEPKPIELKIVGELNYINCSKCSKIFFNKYSLLKHMKDAHECVFIRCAKCDCSFYKEAHLRKHYAKVHANKP